MDVNTFDTSRQYTRTSDLSRTRGHVTTELKRSPESVESSS